MSQTVFRWFLLVMLVLSIGFFGNRILAYLKFQYPNLDGGISATITMFCCIAIALAASFLVGFLYRFTKL